MFESVLLAPLCHHGGQRTGQVNSVTASFTPEAARARILDSGVSSLINSLSSPWHHSQTSFLSSQSVNAG
jgi:hypothetical protein